MRWRNETLIEAPVDLVWQLTIDVANWPSITPTVLRVDRLDDQATDDDATDDPAATAGPVRVGSSVRMKQPGQPVAVWTVTKMDPGREFSWQTKRMGLTMAASHRLSADGGSCRNELILDLTGPAARLFGMVFGGMVRTALETENAGFKARAESGQQA
jgi:hypothetical protein